MAFWVPKDQGKPVRRVIIRAGVQMADELRREMYLWFLETVACYTSFKNACTYSLTHHFNNVKRLLNDDMRSDAMYAALQADEPERCFEGKQLALLQYASKLTTQVANMEYDDFEELKVAGCDDGEILEVNQVVAYFNYSNRTLNGLGVTTEGDVLGYYQE